MAESRDGVRILYVDDDPSLTELVETYLEREREEFVVDTATSGEAGLERVAEEAVDCIVSDYDMPGLDGLEFLDAVRETEPDIPFILYTGKGSEEVASQAIANGVTFYQQKETGTEQYELLANNVLQAVRQRRARAEAARHRRDLRQYKLALESSEDLVAAVDDDGRYLFANGTFCDYHGVEQDDIGGQSVEAVLGAAAAAEVEPHLERVLDGERVQFEMGYAFPERGDRYFDVRYFPIRSEADEVTGAVAQMRDVTDRRARERRLELYESIVQHTEDGVYVLDGEGRFEFVNDRVVEASGIEEEHWVGQPVSVLADLEMVTAAEASAIEEGAEAVRTGERDEVRVELSPDLPSEVTDLVLRLTPLPVEEETLVLGLSRDVSTLKDRERELETKHKRLRTVVEHVPVVLFAFDSDGVFTLSEGRSLAAIGLEPGEVVGESVFDVYADNPEVLENARRALSGEEVVDTVDLGERTFKSWYQPVEAGEDVQRVIGVSMDVTDRTEHERTLERQNERLDEFASMVSHDLRNPLNVADGRLELARDDCESEHLEAVERAHDRMETLIDDLLAMARSEAEATSTETLALSAVVGDCWETVETAEASIDVETDRAVLADRNQLKQLLENLFRNAVVHGGDGVTVTVGDLPEGFFVADDGVGFPGADHEQVFESGQTADRDGVGIGLTIVQQIAERHDWSVRATDSADGGARIEFSGVDLQSG